MKTILLSVCALLMLGLLAGCSTTGSQSDNSSGTKMSGYVDTSAQKKF
jgi:hypothetical protein